MMNTQQDAATPAAVDGAAAVNRPNMALRFLHWYWGKREEGEKGNPVTRTLIAFVLVALGVAGSEAYQWGRGKLVGPDEYLVGIKEQQEVSFQKLQASLDSLTSGNSDAVSQVRGAVDEIRSLNSSLVARLQLANAENERVARVVGVPGGLDMILTPNTGMALDPQSEVGVQRISDAGATVSVTAGGAFDRQFLRTGEAIGYTGADGRDCRVILRSVDPRSAVSLANRCS